MKPFIKWAGGKRWLVTDSRFRLPTFSGIYIEPFLGGGAVYFHLKPQNAIISDINPRLIETYIAVRDDWVSVDRMLRKMQTLHSTQYYYEERKRRRRKSAHRAAQFLYLNRTCWNGLYRENLKGEFNVPIGTKTKIIGEDEDLQAISGLLGRAEIVACDFELTMKRAGSGDLVFVDPPYTTAHNHNGFVKYNQKIFSWEDQIRLKNAVQAAVERGATVALTNADHPSVRELYKGLGDSHSVERASVISGKASHRRATTEALYIFN